MQESCFAFLTWQHTITNMQPWPIPETDCPSCQNQNCSHGDQSTMVALWYHSTHLVPWYHITLKPLPWKLIFIDEQFDLIELVTTAASM